jgi:hypothetical protein
MVRQAGRHQVRLLFPLPRPVNPPVSHLEKREPVRATVWEEAEEVRGKAEEVAAAETVQAEAGDRAEGGSDEKKTAPGDHQIFS